MREVTHILYEQPAFEEWEMAPGLEKLAHSLIVSGLLRIDAYEKSNFVRFYHPKHNVSLIFSKREILDPKLLVRTKNTIRYLFMRRMKKAQLEAFIEKEIKRLTEELQRNIDVEDELELKIARLIVQSAHPSIVMLLIAENAEMFISYAHNVGDVMDVQSWQKYGSSGGLQKVNSVYVSSGGDPFYLLTKEEEEKDLRFGDGPPSLAYLVTTSGHELGHFADMVRDKKGRIISYHTSNLAGNIPNEKARIRRIKDLRNITKIESMLVKFGLREAVEAERHLKFYRKQHKSGRFVNRAELKAKAALKKLLKKCAKAKLNYVFEFAKTDYLATYIAMAINDARINLAPNHEAYKRDNALAQEAIACTEAIARVKQMALTWGDKVVEFMVPNLYYMFHQEIIQNVIKAYENQTGTKYKNINTKRRKSILRSTLRNYKNWRFQKKREKGPE